MDKMFGDLGLVFKSRKDFKAYKQYKKEQALEDKKFREALKLVKITPEQSKRS
ncbi:MAG: hypothetical protein MZU97_09025 [Bacillus subtilis]|nr:hypothetical protein [Bacillus subtilis]